MAFMGRRQPYHAFMLFGRLTEVALACVLLSCKHGDPTESMPSPTGSAEPAIEACVAKRSPSDSVVQVSSSSNGQTGVEVVCLASDHDGDCLVRVLSKMSFPKAQRMIVTRSGHGKWPDIARVIPFDQASAIFLEAGCKL